MNLPAIRLRLQETQKNFDKINATLSVKRTPPSDEVINNLLAGYALLDRYLADDMDLFAYGHSEHLLALNQTVLCHTAAISETERLAQFEATKAHFYSSENNGIGAINDWLSLHRSASVWKRAAGVFTLILSQPQLFLEGNHRTGSLIMSYFLMRAGHAPFVLSFDNAHHFFEPAEFTKKRRKKQFLDDVIHLPKQTRKFANLLKNEQKYSQFLLS
ncbi:hypothetical protein Q7C_2240 [Methylophaga frappieri]|uniref:Fido domain-containing protein n=2 Tax=Methylophaga frappieri (strain ATCC BAA-2434 / DSM 25690 / JAM7) TaxID=754477 RepID=I1YKD3_METFJ|nr:hypothetical protein Q7C_2240 [Methylophaga frappieri]